MPVAFKSSKEMEIAAKQIVEFMSQQLYQLYSFGTLKAMTIAYTMFPGKSESVNTFQNIPRPFQNMFFFLSELFASNFFVFKCLFSLLQKKI